MAHHFEFPSVGAGDWVDITPIERKRNLDFSSFIFKGPLINRVQRCFRWPLDKVHVALAEYMRLMMLKEELGDTEGHIVVVPPVIARVWECHIIDTADYRACMEKIMGVCAFFDYNPEMTNVIDEDIKAEKVSQLEMFYRGKFGHDPDPLYWSFDAPPPSNANNNIGNPAPSSRFLRGVGAGGDDHAVATIRRHGNPSSLYPVGSGRFPRDLSGIMRHGRNDRPPPRPRSPSFRSKWREDDEFGDGDSGRRKAGNESGDAPYLPDLEPFIGEYRRANKNEVEGEQEGVNFNGRNASAGSWRDGQRPNQPDEGADPGPVEGMSSLSADTPLTSVGDIGRVFRFVVKCKEPRVRLVISNLLADSTVASLKKQIRDLSSDQIPPEFNLINLGKRIDLDDAMTLVDAGTLDGDIITIQPC